MSAHESTQSNGAEHRILVVDDEPSIVDAVATALRYEGYEVEEAGSGREALAALREDVVHPWTGPMYEMPEPSFALLVGHEVAYYASYRKN